MGANIQFSLDVSQLHMVSARTQKVRKGKKKVSLSNHVQGFFSVIWLILGKNKHLGSLMSLFLLERRDEEQKWVRKLSC